MHTSPVSTRSCGNLELTDSLFCVQPCYKWWEVPYYWAGLKAYDLVAGTQGLTLSRFTTANESRRQFPTLAQHGPNHNSLKGTVSTWAVPGLQQLQGSRSPGIARPWYRRRDDAPSLKK